jgi:hypothetical protein
MSHGADFSRAISRVPHGVPAGVALRCSAALFAGIFGAHWVYSQWAERAMVDFLQNIVFWIGVSQGGFMLAVALTLTKGRWGRPLKRIAEAFAIMMPVLYIGLITFLLLGGIEVFPWVAEARAHTLPAHKAVYLTEPFFLWRQIIGLGILIGLDWMYIKASWRPDIGLMAEKLGDQAPGWYCCFTKNWTNLEDEIERSEQQQRKWGALIVVAYSLIFSIVSVDLSMSLAPHWFANMFPAWFFMSSMWSGLVAIGIFSILAGRWLHIEYLLKPVVYHDLGKLIFAFCMFWGYTTYAQYLAIWYGNMTEETGFILLRTQLEPWAGLSKVVVMACFVIPWTLLLSRGMKKIRSSFLAVSTLILVGIWLERFVVMVPSVWRGDNLPIGLGEVLMPLGFGGVMVLLVCWVLSKIPATPVTDKMSAPNDLEVHVHPRHEHHAAK